MFLINLGMYLEKSPANSRCLVLREIQTVFLSAFMAENTIQKLKTAVWCMGAQYSFLLFFPAFLSP